MGDLSPFYERKEGNPQPLGKGQKMVQTLSQTVQVPLILMVIDITEKTDQLGIPCPGCGYSLGLHQPEEDRPTRLLGTCDHCSCWAVIDLVSNGSAKILALPEPDSLRL